MPDTIDDDLARRIRERANGSTDTRTWKTMVSTAGLCDNCRCYTTQTLQDRRLVELMLTEVSLEPQRIEVLCGRCVYKRVRAAARATMKTLDAEHEGGRFIHNKTNGTVRCAHCGGTLCLSCLTSERLGALKEIVEFVSTHRRAHGEDMRGRVSIVAGEGGELSVAHAGEGALSGVDP